MRNLKLTHEEIALIQEALGIAEKEYGELHKHTVELFRVRGNENSSEHKTHGMYYYDYSWKFGELNEAIKNSEKDV